MCGDAGEPPREVSVCGWKDDVMRTVGAKFIDRPSALHAVEHVRSRFGGGDVAVAPLADGFGSSTLVAATIEDTHRDEAVSILIHDGGEMVADVDLGVG